MNIEFEHRIVGDIVGPIWMPAVTCSKPVSYDLTREDARFTRPGTLRDHVLRVTNDGDFQHANLSAATSWLVTRVTSKRDGGVTRSRERWWPLSEFRSVADCITDEEPFDGSDDD